MVPSGPTEIWLNCNSQRYQKEQTTVKKVRSYSWAIFERLYVSDIITLELHSWLRPLPSQDILEYYFQEQVQKQEKMYKWDTLFYRLYNQGNRFLQEISLNQ